METTLQELFGFPEGAPEDLAALQFLSDDALEHVLSGDQLDLARALRTQTRRAAMAWGRSSQLDSAEAVERALADGDLTLISRRWVTLALDRNRRRSFVAFSADSARTVQKLSRRVPDAEDLPVLPDGDGVYLVLYGGGPDVLEIPDVRQRLVTLQASVPVADVLFRHLEPGPKSTLYSLRQGFGVHNRTRVEFPEPDLIEEVAQW